MHAMKASTGAMDLKLRRVVGLYALWGLVASAILACSWLLGSVEEGAVLSALTLIPIALITPPLLATSVELDLERCKECRLAKLCRLLRMNRLLPPVKPLSQPQWAKPYPYLLFAVAAWVALYLALLKSLLG